MSRFQTLAVFLCLSAASFAFGEVREEILLASDQALSPDGKTLVFSWNGDVWSAPVQGGAARRLTEHPAQDREPRFSPDGKEIAFTSERDGSRQVYVMPAEGGAPERLTYHTAGYFLIEWYPDGKSLLVQGMRDHFYRDTRRFFRISREGRGPERLLFDDYGIWGALSPDAQKLLFTREGVAWWWKGYRGSTASQVWMYDLGAKTFTKLLVGETESRSPVWKPDGKGFYYVGAQSGSFNLWEYDLESGHQKQLTRFDDDSVVSPCISRDGSTIVFRYLFDFYRFCPGKTAEPEKIALWNVSDSERPRVARNIVKKADEAAFSDDGLEVAFIAGADLWVMDTVLREPRQVTSTAAEESNPVFESDGDRLYFISNQEGQRDVWSARRSDKKKYWWQNETFSLDRVTSDSAAESRLTISPDGTRIAYVKEGGGLWIADLDGRDAKRLIPSWDMPDYAWAPDGNWIVYAIDDADFNRDIWIVPVDGSREPVNISRHPYDENFPDWSPDGKIIAFTSRRNDREEIDIHYVWLPRQEDEKSKRDRSIEEALEKMDKVRKKKKGKTDVKKEDGKTTETAASEIGRNAEETSDTLTTETAPETSPTLKTEPTGGITPPTLSPGPGAQPTTLTLQQQKEIAGKILSGARRFGKAALTLEKDIVKGTWKKRKKNLPKVEIDFEKIHERVRRVAIPDSTETGLFWSHDSKKLAFTAKVKGKEGTYTVEFPDKLEPKMFSEKKGTGARWLKEGNQIVWLSDGVPGNLSSDGKAESYAFEARQEVDIAARYRACFVLAWRLLRDRWYDENLNHRDWDRIRAKYEDMAARAVDADTFGRVVSLMLGELNGSHLDFYPKTDYWTPPDGWKEETAHLGLRFEADYSGPGLKVRDVLPDGVADKVRSRIEPGEIVSRMDGTTVTAEMDLTTVLNGPLDRDVRLSVKNAEGKIREVTLRPISYSSVADLLRKKWIRDNQALVNKLTSGTLGYLHVPSMNWPSFHEFEREVYAEGAGKKGLIIDVRFNGGGFTADHLLTVLCQPSHAISVPRGGKPGYPQDRRVYVTWDKPVAVLCNQKSFSNAEHLSHAIKTLGRGPLVGAPTVGAVISTYDVDVMGLGRLRIPFRGYFTIKDGQDMEGHGAVPDYVLWPEPGELPRGKDVQLEKAIEVLQDRVKKSPPPPRLIKRSERATN